MNEIDMRLPVNIILKAFAGWLRNRSGTTAIEYTLIASIISLGIMVGAGMLGTSVGELYTGLAQDLTKASNQ
ncbi:Flp family type IVb pilin [Phyllobacterium endophyticum]|jgi:pilus assembly protein Flp/PilA|nr:Flp family type IVb pilin [Phyllobacterium endophyticum]MBB3235345.1 pilus assembly protein Flp/PilA [Phyllobacterium endophyticum]